MIAVVSVTLASYLSSDDTSVMSHKATIMTWSLFSLALCDRHGRELTAAYPILTRDDTIPLASHHTQPLTALIRLCRVFIHHGREVFAEDEHTHGRAYLNIIM